NAQLHRVSIVSGRTRSQTARGPGSPPGPLLSFARSLTSRFRSVRDRELRALAPRGAGHEAVGRSENDLPRDGLARRDRDVRVVRRARHGRGRTAEREGLRRPQDRAEAVATLVERERQRSAQGRGPGLPWSGVTGLPLTGVPPVSQVPVAIGPQMKKLTVPVGIPPAIVPVTTARSVIESPSWIAPLEGDVVVLDGTFATVKHSF